MDYVKSSKISLKDYPELNEKWLQKQIADDPAILGLGDDVELIEVERRQSTGGRLDLLLKDSELNKRFTVELQLGEFDPDHIIRTIEYWDIERKRSPQFKHYAVIVAEEITSSRFWNVINLFNGSIPLIAVQLDAREVEGKLTLNFIKVLDAIELGIMEEDDRSEEPTDRAYWEEKSTPDMLSAIDGLKSTLNNFFPKVELNYTKFYIGLKKNDVVNNFVFFRPFKKWLDIRVPKNKIAEKTMNHLEDAGLRFDWKDRTHESRYRIRLSKQDLEQKMPHIEALFKEVGEFQENKEVKKAA